MRQLSPMRAVAVQLSAAAVLATPVVAMAQNIVLEQILVKVNGTIITQTEFEERQVQVLREQRQQGFINENTTDAVLEDLLNQMTPQLIVDAIDELLIVQHGRELGIEMDTERFNEIVENVKERNNIETDEEFAEELAANGMTMEDLERAMDRQFIMSTTQQIEVIRKIAVTDTEAREYYNENPDEYRTPGQITLREILIAAPPEAATGADNRLLNVAAEAGLEAEAMDALASLAVGESFAAVAARVSDAPSKANGGLIGPLNEDELAPTVMRLVEDFVSGDVTEPVRTAIGYQLFQLESATPASRQPFDDVRADIADRVFNERREVEFKAFMERLHAEAVIEWRNDNLREAYEAQVGTTQPATSS